jgi:N-acyl homoserine lactone hydrolase
MDADRNATTTTTGVLEQLGSPCKASARVAASAVVVSLRIWVVALALGGLGLAGCEQERRVPYIPPTLANWPQPYHGVAGLKVHVFVTGYLDIPEALVLRGGSLTRTRRLPIPAVLIEHPKQGLVLFNTGTGAQPGTASGGWLDLLESATARGEGVKAQLQRAGFRPDAVHWVVLSTMRADHTGEVESFPNARVVVAKAEYEYARQAPAGYAARDFDDVASWKFLDFEAAKPLGTFLAHVDLFGDGSCLALDASGTTPGTLALLLRLPRQPVLLADDLAAVEENLRYAAQPAAVADMDEWWDHIWRLKRLKDRVPELIVLLGHDVEAARRATTKEIIFHEPPPSRIAGQPTPTPDLLHRLIPKPM